jgi:hypothetical protein
LLKLLFEKQLAENALKSIGDGAPLAAGDSHWSRARLLQLAGVMVWAAANSDEPVDADDTECGDLLAELLHAVKASCRLTQNVVEGTFGDDLLKVAIVPAESGFAAVAISGEAVAELAVSCPPRGEHCKSLPPGPPRTPGEDGTI